MSVCVWVCAGSAVIASRFDRANRRRHTRDVSRAHTQGETLDSYSHACANRELRAQGTMTEKQNQKNKRDEKRRTWVYTIVIVVVVVVDMLMFYY